jgi:hypothetical protein
MDGRKYVNLQWNFLGLTVASCCLNQSYGDRLCLHYQGLHITSYNVVCWKLWLLRRYSVVDTEKRDWWIIAQFWVLEALRGEHWLVKHMQLWILKTVTGGVIFSMHAGNRDFWTDMPTANDKRVDNSGCWKRWLEKRYTALNTENWPVKWYTSVDTETRNR